MIPVLAGERAGGLGGILDVGSWGQDSVSFDRSVARAAVSSQVAGQAVHWLFLSSREVPVIIPTEPCPACGRYWGQQHPCAVCNRRSRALRSRRRYWELALERYWSQDKP